MSDLKTCSLWEAFDKLQLCYTIAPQMKHYYRFGAFKDCQELRDEFNFCWTARGKTNVEQDVFGLIAATDQTERE
ncbi:hypothetical protein EDD86DRAFT_148120 [Gorgonomyces haynaldii]|nr:hypothetical protein EDD86DRAFT_148120 [Gorgonomyces haynaldii]